MSKVLLVTPLHTLVIATTLILMTGCSAPANQNAQKTDIQTVADSSHGNGHAKSEEACSNNLLTKALPPKTTINDLPFERWDCTFNTARAEYGTKGGKEVEITLTDTRSPNINSQPDSLHDFYTHMGETVRQSAQFIVQTSVDTRKNTPAVPGALEAIGGPDYLPIIESTLTGDPLVIQVGAKDDHTPAEVEALLRDRYALSISGSDKSGQISGLSGSQAQTLYDPFLKQMHLDSLP
ncbi:hypothetical protein [Dyella acidisoli]|uniref:DUF3558 domain-containing protein n=1 Tax=Dyella acidisoli TaxID=1867834 RepID=A0ABQ5XJJ9_9GAMM|nr:hypothetical protein [Dyella acidisoli]GLQ91527.1 hypothetical protein GCM10007901_04770 [Dyella acidisoli]